MQSRTIIISDLHVGSGQLDDCDAELEACLVRFLREYLPGYAPVELVINGDFLDFVQAEPYEGADFEAEHNGIPLCFTQEQSVRKLESMVASHCPIFTALGEFLAAHAENSLVVLPGNHDADFFWPDVRARFKKYVAEANVGVESRINFKLEPYYRPASSPEVWIEHGHQYDPNNRFFIVTDEIDPDSGDKVKKPVWSEASPPIFKDRTGKERLYECIGTRFMIQFMNGLDAKYPFVDNVKPFSRFLRIFGLSAFNPKFILPKVAASIWKMMCYLTKEGIKNPGSLLSAEKVGQQFGPAPLLQAIVGAMTEADVVWLVGELKARGFALNTPPAMFVKNLQNAERLMTFLADNVDLLERVEQVKLPVLGFAPGTLSMGKAFFVDETDELTKKALKVLEKEGVAYVIMGHTHEPVAGQRYINTGCWTRYYRFDGDRDMSAWNVLKENSYELFPYELRYAEIVPGQPPQTRVFSEKKK